MSVWQERVPFKAYIKLFPQFMQKRVVNQLVVRNAEHDLIVADQAENVLFGRADNSYLRPDLTPVYERRQQR